MTLLPGEGDRIKDDGFLWQWNGWRNKRWPSNIIEPGLRFYAFDGRKNRRMLCALLEVNRGGSFRYKTREDFARQVEELTGRFPDRKEPRWDELPEPEDGKPCTGIAFTWK